MRPIDWRAASVGAVVGLVLALPAALVGAIVVNDDSNNGVFVFYLLIMAGVLGAGFVAGSRRPDSPLTHGAVAALLTYLVAQAFAVVVKAIGGKDLRSPAVYVFNALMAASLGIVGALVADRRNARARSSP